MNIIDKGDLIAFRDDLGHDVAWDSLGYPDATPEAVAEFNDAFEYVRNGYSAQWHTDGDTYQGSTFMRVIRRKADGKLFGFSYWEGGGKYGEALIEHNGDDHGFPSKYDFQDGVDEDEVWYVFRPVELAPLPAYKFIGSDRL